MRLMCVTIAFVLTLTNMGYSVNGWSWGGWNDWYNEWKRENCGKKKGESTDICKSVIGQTSITAPKLATIQKACKGIEFVDSQCNEHIPSEVIETCKYIKLLVYKPPKEVLDYAHKICGGFLKSIGEVVGHLVNGDFSEAWDSAKEVGSSVADHVEDTANSVVDTISGWFGRKKRSWYTQYKLRGMEI